MYIVVVTLFVFVLTVDFLGAVSDRRPQVSEMLIRGAMLLAFVWIVNHVPIG